MDKEEILAKSRAENRNGDERDRQIETRATMYGFIGMSVGYIVMLLLEIFLKGRPGYGYMFMFSVFLLVSSVSRYKMSGSKAMLFAAVCWTACSVIWFVLYLAKG